MTNIPRNIAWIILVLTVCTLRCTPSQETSHSPKPQSPNVIIILTDDQGYKDVGFNGSTEIATPNIDRISQNGVVFTNGYVSYAVCGPSRAGLITGRYQDRFGFSLNPLFAPKDSTQGLPRTEQTLAEALQQANYRNMAIGKWHLGAHESLRPLNRGFDEFFGFLTGGHRYFPEEWTLNDISEVTTQNSAYRTKLLRNDQRIDEQEYLTDALSREAVSFVERSADNPFFLYLAYNAPHTPMQATQKYLDRFPHIENERRRTYAAMVSAVDDGVGNLLDKLEELGISENTMVFFLSDNGGPEPKNKSDNGSLREGKGSMYEGGIRVPFAVQWPAVLPRNTRYDHPVISLDMFATAVAAAGVTPANDLDGVNLVPFLTGQNTSAPHDRLYWRQVAHDGLAIRQGDMKLVKDKLGNTELYNITTDISEEQQLSDTILFNQLSEMHRAWNESNQPPIFMGLLQNGAYNKMYPDRFVNVEKY